MGNFCIAVNLKNKAVTQYHDFDFDSITESSIGHVATSDTGLKLINSGYSDNGNYIEAFGKLFQDDFGKPNKKRVRYMTMGLEGSNDVLVEVVMDEDEHKREDYIIAVKSRTRAGLCRKSGRRRQSGRYIEFTLKNIKGGYFALNAFKATTIDRNINHL